MTPRERAVARTGRIFDRMPPASRGWTATLELAERYELALELLWMCAAEGLLPELDDEVARFLAEEPEGDER